MIDPGFDPNYRKKNKQQNKGCLTTLLGMLGTGNDRYNGRNGNGYQPKADPKTKGLVPLHPNIDLSKKDKTMATNFHIDEVHPVKRNEDKNMAVMIDGGGCTTIDGVSVKKPEFFVMGKGKQEHWILCCVGHSESETRFFFGKEMLKTAIFNDKDFLKEFMKFTFPGIEYSILEKH